MKTHIPVEQLRTEDLLRDWQWLCPEPVELVAVSAFGELVLRTEDGSVKYLDIHAGTLEPLADSVPECESLLEDPKKSETVLKLQARDSVLRRGINLGPEQCLTYKIPIVVAEGPHDICAMNVYEAVGFLGDFHRQIKELPSGSKIRLVVK